ncbi:anhydro-N-acetylmuramic acid kinase [Kordiimonas sp. SCSIO 12610]|uniref:anhydro-N-acetylmuramic acid kinase n=1 Tax=Kordiimonas sp. SCSIO 12610 TaxID=2829597 RepID=UPI00210A150E|nr:anhydro-N-acetylmuramic acid kinase [Kordiimonas sp. SCSIO 12610]UTW53856.1 anhydro-N-acetylmuramic acid kinase [Kordiimonas sp. SCSIO 12610]
MSAKNKTLCAVGLMSGTSMDGVDAAILYTNGETIERHGPSLTMPYTDGLRSDIQKAVEAAANLPAITSDNEFINEVADNITDFHSDAVFELESMLGAGRDQIDIIGFHGHTVTHRPERGWTWQIGDGGRLAGNTGISVVADMRTNDMLHGGEGAPIVPIYHSALLKKNLKHKTIAVLNIGGVANVTWVKFDETGELIDIVAFDTGPGNALLDDWMLAHTGKAIDFNGETAATGLKHEEIIMGLMASPYFDEKPPKTLDRNDFNMQSARGLSLEDGAATLTSFVVESVVAAQSHFPSTPDVWYICGGGRHNTTLMRRLRRHLPALVEPVESLGWRGDALEAEAFAFLAVRSLYGLPLSLPKTTGCEMPVTGGVLHKTRKRYARR